MKRVSVISFTISLKERKLSSSSMIEINSSSRIIASSSFMISVGIYISIALVVLTKEMKRLYVYLHAHHFPFTNVSRKVWAWAYIYACEGSKIRILNVAKIVSLNDTLIMLRLTHLLFLLLSGCYWQEQFCYIGKDPELIQTESYYDDCRAINYITLRME